MDLISHRFSTTLTTQEAISAEPRADSAAALEHNRSRGHLRISTVGAGT